MTELIEFLYSTVLATYPWWKSPCQCRFVVENSIATFVSVFVVENSITFVMEVLSF